MSKFDYDAIASKTQDVCSNHGYGHQVLVWPEGDTSEAISSNDVIARARGNDDSGRTIWERPIARLRSPMNVEAVEFHLSHR